MCCMGVSHRGARHELCGARKRNSGGKTSCKPAQLPLAARAGRWQTSGRCDVYASPPPLPTRSPTIQRPCRTSVRVQAPWRAPRIDDLLGQLVGGATATNEAREPQGHVRRRSGTCAPWRPGALARQVRFGNSISKMPQNLGRTPPAPQAPQGYMSGYIVATPTSRRSLTPARTRGYRTSGLGCSH